MAFPNLAKCLPRAAQLDPTFSCISASAVSLHVPFLGRLLQWFCHSWSQARSFSALVSKGQVFKRSPQVSKTPEGFGIAVKDQ